MVYGKIFLNLEVFFATISNKIYDKKSKSYFFNKLKENTNYQKAIDVPNQYENKFI
jgi:hypothetical protein